MFYHRGVFFIDNFILQVMELAIIRTRKRIEVSRTDNYYLYVDLFFLPPCFRLFDKVIIRIGSDKCLLWCPFALVNLLKISRIINGNSYPANGMNNFSGEKNGEKYYEISFFTEST